MKVLIVCRSKNGKISPFISEQVDFIKKNGIECQYFFISSSGIKGYLKTLKSMKAKINSFQPDLIHAHYGLSGLLANLQRTTPVVTTYHGSDINLPKAFRLSKFAIRLSKYNIFVSQKNLDKSSKYSKKLTLIPCGVDTNFFSPIEQSKAKAMLQFTSNKKRVLFAGAFSNNVKNSKLAMEAISLLENIELIELKGYTRQQVVHLMNAVDVCLMTSFTEGSPQFIKEAMACNCPIVSTDVGDVSSVISGVEGCYISSYDPKDVANKISLAIEKNSRTNGKNKIEIMKLDSNNIAKRIVEIYKKVVGCI